MASLFWDEEGILLVDFLEKSNTINSQWYKETSNKCIHTPRPTEILEDVLHSHTNAQTHTSFHTCEAIAKMGQTVLPHPAHILDLAPSNYHLFAPVKNSQHCCHFADGNELKQSFYDVLRGSDREFYNTGIQHLNQCWQKCVENDTNFVAKTAS
jgi:hypothetical protein